MRSNKKRIDARIPNWLREALLEMAWKRGYNFTEMLQAAAEKGLMWYQKQWEKMHQEKKDASEDTPKSCPNSYENDTKKHNKKKIVTDDEVDAALAELYGDKK